MIELIDKAIKSLATEVIDSKYKGSADGALKLTQAISNLTHSKINLIEYDRISKEHLKNK